MSRHNDRTSSEKGLTLSRIQANSDAHKRGAEAGREWVATAQLGSVIEVMESAWSATAYKLRLRGGYHEEPPMDYLPTLEETALGIVVSEILGTWGLAPVTAENVAFELGFLEALPQGDDEQNRTPGIISRMLRRERKALLGYDPIIRVRRAA